MKNITIKDVAKIAGVSISTVSNALNNVDVLTLETKKHILNVVKDLNYTPNLKGKHLKASKTNMIGFFTTSVNGPYFHELVEAMSKECERHGYVLNIFVSNTKEMILNNIFGGPIDGAIIFVYDFINEAEVITLENNNLNAVFIDREISSKNIGSIIFDSYTYGYEATSYLINQGHKRIAFIEGYKNNYDSEQRKKGYKEALADNKININSQYIIKGNFEEEVSFENVKTFVRENKIEVPEAFFAGNDLSAIGCIRALESEGYVVPEDVSVIGFDDIEISQYHQPSITTVKTPITEQGILAVQHLIKLINNEEVGKICKIPGEIISRESTAQY